MTQENIRSFLSTVFGVDQKYITPLQGNWYNPQDKEKLKTFVAFKMEHATSRVLPFYRETKTTATSCVEMNGVLQLQIVGSSAESLTRSIAHWTHRNDVQLALDAYKAQVYADGLGEYLVTDFGQDGGNTVWAYNTKINLQWEDQIEVLNPIILRSATISGTVL